MNTDDFADTGKAEAGLSALRCPFCNTTGVEAKQVLAHRSSTQEPGVQAIFEMQLHCRKCNRGYRQTCPESLLPESLKPAVD